MLTIGQLAACAGVTIKTVRHYHQRGLLEEPTRDAPGYRRYGARPPIDLVQMGTLAEARVPLARIKEVNAADPRPTPAGGCGCRAGNRPVPEPGSGRPSSSTMSGAPKQLAEKDSGSGSRSGVLTPSAFFALPLPIVVSDPPARDQIAASPPFATVLDQLTIPRDGGRMVFTEEVQSKIC